VVTASPNRLVSARLPDCASEYCFLGPSRLRPVSRTVWSSLTSYQKRICMSLHVGGRWRCPFRRYNALSAMWLDSGTHTARPWRRSGKISVQAAPRTKFVSGNTHLSRDLGADSPRLLVNGSRMLGTRSAGNELSPREGSSGVRLRSVTALSPLFSPVSRLPTP
jgi:hypothetical protein